MILKLKTKNLVLMSFNRSLLDALIENDQTNYYSWFGNQEITKYNSHGLFPQSKKELNNFLDSIDNGDKAKLVFAIMKKDAVQHIGMASLQRIDFINRSAEFAIIIGEKLEWGKGYSTEAVKALFDHSFMRLGLNRIWSGTSSLNIGMLKCFAKLGMTHEGTFKQGQFLNGKFENVESYRILRSEYDEQKFKE